MTAPIRTPGQVSNQPPSGNLAPGGAPPPTPFEGAAQDLNLCAPPRPGSHPQILLTPALPLRDLPQRHLQTPVWVCLKFGF